MYEQAQLSSSFTSPRVTYLSLSVLMLTERYLLLLAILWLLYGC